MGKSGFNASLTVGAYTGAELDDVTVEINHTPVDVTDLASDYVERVGGLRDWSITGRKRYATQAFLTLAASGTTSVNCIVKNPSATTVFSGPGFVTRGMLNFPKDAAGEEITVVGNGTAPTVAAV